jgi:predicted membrane protein
VRARPCMRAFSLKNCGIIKYVYVGNNNCERKISDALFFQVSEIQTYLLRNFHLAVLFVHNKCPYLLVTSDIKRKKWGKVDVKKNERNI